MRLEAVTSGEATKKSEVQVTRTVTAGGDAGRGAVHVSVSSVSLLGDLKPLDRTPKW